MNLTDPSGLHGIEEQAAGVAAGTISAVATGAFLVGGTLVTASACAGGLGGEGCIDTFAFTTALTGAAAYATYASFDYAFTHDHAYQTDYPCLDTGTCGA